MIKVRTTEIGQLLDRCTMHDFIVWCEDLMKYLGT